MAQGRSNETCKEFLNNPFGGKDLMMTPDMPIMDSPLPGNDHGRKAQFKTDCFIGENANSESSGQFQRSEESSEDFNRGTPASAEEQLQILKRVTRMRNNLNTSKKTQVHQKVDYVFYWADKNQGSTHVKVEIMGEFSNWKPILMKEIQDADKADLDDMPSSSDGAATHYLRKDVDPTLY